MLLKNHRLKMADIFYKIEAYCMLGFKLKLYDVILFESSGFK